VARNKDSLYLFEACAFLFGRSTNKRRRARDRSRLRALTESGALRIEKDERGRALYPRAELDRWRREHPDEFPATVTRPLARTEPDDVAHDGMDATTRDETERLERQRLEQRALIERRRRGVG
jgi:hypothetical protein